MMKKILTYDHSVIMMTSSVISFLSISFCRGNNYCSDFFFLLLESCYSDNLSVFSYIYGG